MLFQLQYDKKNKKEIECYPIVNASYSNKGHKKEFYLLILNGNVPLCVFNKISFQGSLILGNKSGRDPGLT